MGAALYAAFTSGFAPPESIPFTPDAHAKYYIDMISKQQPDSTPCLRVVPALEALLTGPVNKALEKSNFTLSCDSYIDQYTKVDYKYCCWRPMPAKE